MKDMKLCGLNHQDSIAQLPCIVCGRNVILIEPHFVVNARTCHPDCALAFAFIEEET